ncbi:hypothetical protein DFP73DRAFT_59294 [Morchella snyderi]|nr:hypothetical protein DFP73DRAFT_59294 [Morchella snyderi]
MRSTLRVLFQSSLLAMVAGNKVPSLKHFIQRARVLALWRDILRALKRVNDPVTKSELYDYARQEILRNKNIDDIIHIRYLISTGRKEFETMEQYTFR